TRQYKIFKQIDGLQDNEFNQGAAFQDTLTGTLFFGGINGLNAVEPNDLQLNEFVPPVVFTDLEYYNQSSNGEAIVVDNFSGQEPLKLTYKENIIRIKFAAMNFIQPEKNQYQYQLKGFSNQWFDLKNTHEVIFTDLDSKKYTLNVNAANNDGKWNEKALSLPLTITPPLSKTTLAYILYGLLIILLLQVIYQFFLSRRLRIAENQQLQEMDQLKTKFFTNIAHDFKSPLTVILSTIKSLPPNNRTRILVERSGKSLLDLINQMLELRKLESNKLSLRLIQGDAIECIRYTFESFQEIGREQNVKLHFIASEPQLLMDFDEEKLSRVVSNLFSNAIKYNKAEGNVYLLLDQIEKEEGDYLSIRVKDTGIGIASVDIDQIFNRFYQINPAVVEGVKSGSGVGLALTRELVHFLGGTILVKSKLGIGSEFTVLLPVKNQAQKTAFTPAKSQVKVGLIPSVPTASIEGISSTQSLDKKRLLLIEDHRDIAEVLIQLLSPYYAVELAPDGEAGIAIAQAQIPDLIISDVMMPKKDGYEVLKVLKTDEKTLHIPIILLTAKSGLDSRIEGLQKGADAYIGKPFSNTELLAQVENLLANRIKLQRFYQQNLIAEHQDATLVEEDPFIARAKDILLENISDEGFRIPQLTKAMGVSRTQLHNKLKAITGKSTSHFINAIRLQKGREMLLKSNLTISEIAYEVGFRDPNYFSGRYKDFFNQTPTETRK
ncbi:MAG: hybrid sensor histidine kinase/response regulator transcription factor, partial [Bacteroidota bacterium]